jgi:capsular exopolysaccharide synthesis family protein
VLAQFLRPYTPLYKATFDLGVSRERPVEGFFSSGISEAPSIQIGSVTQRVISSLLSVNLAEKVVDSLDLDTYVKSVGSDIDVVIRLKQQIDKTTGPFRLKVSGSGFVVSRNGSIVGKGSLGDFHDIGLFEMKVTLLRNLPEEESYELYLYPRSRIALALRNSLAIKVLEADKIEQSETFEKVPFSGEGADKKLVTAKSIFPGMNLIGILRIDVHWGNPDDALQIAQVLSHQILREDINEKSKQFTQSEVFIDSQLTLYQDRLTAFEEQIKQFKESKNIADLKASTQALINQVSELETKKNQLQIEEKILTDLNNYLASSDPNVDTTPNFAATMLSDAVLRNFYSQLLNTEAELKGRLKEYSSNHPKVMEIRAKLDGLKEQLKDEIRKRIPTIKTEIESYASQIRFLQARLENVPVDEVSLARLERDKETAEKLYTFFAEKLEEARVQEAGVTSDLKIINPAIVSQNPVNSRRPVLTLFLALVIGMLAGGFAVFIAEYVDSTIKDPEVVKAKTNLPIFAMIPVIDTPASTSEGIDTKKEHVSGGTGKKRQAPGISMLSRITRTRARESEELRIIDQDVASPEFESFRKLAMNLDFAHPEKKYRAIYITSAGPEEGKTFVTLNLGLVLNKLGKRVMLIDTDFRKKSGNLTEIAESKEKLGLFDSLRGDLEPEDVKIGLDLGRSGINSHNIQRLDLIPTGEVPPNPFVFLESDKMRDVVGVLRYRYDYVLIDGVPILLFADAAYLADFTDGVLITARYGKTDLKDLEQAKDTLTTAKSNIIGIVINSVPRTKGNYYYKYYHKYYSKYYKPDKQAKKHHG